MEEQEQVDSFLFSVCCERRLNSVAFATDVIRKKMLAFPSINVDTIAAVFAINYQNLALPTTRQHILRMASIFSPEQLESLGDKLDGCSMSKQLEVLSALQKRFGLVVGNDVATTVDPVQCLLLRNRALLEENDTLRHQLAEQRPAAALAELHNDMMQRLYQCVATVEAQKAEKVQLQRTVAEMEERIRCSKETHPSTGGCGAAPAKDAADAWMERCTALQARLESLIESQIDERTAHSVQVQQLRREVATARDALAEQQSRANALAQQLAELKLRGSVVSAAARSQAKDHPHLYRSDAGTQTRWTGSGHSEALVDDCVCDRPTCRQQAQQLEALSSRLVAATRLLSQRH